MRPIPLLPGLRQILATRNGANLCSPKRILEGSAASRAGQSGKDLSLSSEARIGIEQPGLYRQGVTIRAVHFPHVHG